MVRQPPTCTWLCVLHEFPCIDTEGKFAAFKAPNQGPGKLVNDDDDDDDSAGKWRKSGFHGRKGIGTLTSVSCLLIRRRESTGQ